MTKKLIILNSSSLNKLELNENETFLIVKLKHPKLNELAQFLLIKSLDNIDLYDLYELINHNNELTSLFIDDYVQSDSLIYFASKFNFNYFLIDLLSKSGSSFIKLKDVKLKLIEQNKETISSKSNEEDILLNKFNLNTNNLSKLFDAKQSEDDMELKFNSKKLIEWFKEKLNNLVSYMENNNNSFLTSSSSSTSVIFNKTKQQQSDDKSNKIKTEAFNLLGQYLNSTCIDLLRNECNLNNTLNDTSNENNKVKKIKTN